MPRFKLLRHHGEAVACKICLGLCWWGLANSSFFLMSRGGLFWLAVSMTVNDFNSCSFLFDDKCSCYNAHSFKIFCWTRDLAFSWSYFVIYCQQMLSCFLKCRQKIMWKGILKSADAWNLLIDEFQFVGQHVKHKMLLLFNSFQHLLQTYLIVM